MSSLPAVHLVFLHLPKCQYNPINSLRKCPRSSARHRASLSLASAVAQEAGTPRRRERTTLASPKRSPRCPCLGVETDGVVPLKAQHQPTTRPTPPFNSPPTPTFKHMLNYSCSCAPQNLTKDLLRCRYRQMMVAFSMEAA